MVVSFIVISSYISFGTGSPKISNQNQVSGALPQAATQQNTTTYSWATATSPLPSTTSYSTQVANITSARSFHLQEFGNQYFEAPSAILIPAKTLVWSTFRLDGYTNETNPSIHGSVIVFPFSGINGVNITAAIYVNGILNVNSTIPVPNRNYQIQSSLPTSTAPNSIFALTGVTPNVVIGAQTDSGVNLNGATISIAMFCDTSVWLAGWTQGDASKGTGPQFGQSIGQLGGTFETPESSANIPPNLLPNPATTLTFELQIAGDFVQ